MKTCSKCNGQGRIVEYTYVEGHVVITGYPACSDCGGSGKKK